MNGNELLRPGGEKRGGLDASLAAEDLELTRLSQLLFPGLGAEEALDFAFGLLTDDGETIRLRQEILGDLLDHPALRETMEKLRGILEELETCSRGVQDNLTGMKVSRLDAAVDGLKKAVLKLEKNLSQQGADILEENAADNRYAQLLRFTHFRRRLTALYAEAIGLLRGSTRGEKFASASLRALGEWAEACYEKDRVAETEKALRGRLSGRPVECGGPGDGGGAPDALRPPRHAGGGGQRGGTQRRHFPAPVPPDRHRHPLSGIPPLRGGL